MSPAMQLLGTVVSSAVDGVVDAGDVPTSKALDLLRLLVASEGAGSGAPTTTSRLLWPYGRRGARPDEPAHRRGAAAAGVGPGRGAEVR